ncbi:hypothetical protein ACVILH_004428 [Bradyrhizobium sp. USDA 4353]
MSSVGELKANVLGMTPASLTFSTFPVRGMAPPSRGDLRPSCAISRPLLFGRRGAGKTGYRLIPAVRVQQMSTRQNHRFSPISGLPCATVLRVIGALPGDRLSCPRHQRIIITTGLVSASGDQDHTISPSPHSVRRPGCDTRLRSNAPVASPARRFMTIAKRPSSASRDARECGGDLPDEARDEYATNWHDGQLVHAGCARIARRADDQSADRRHQEADGARCMSLRLSSNTLLAAQGA